VGEVIGKSLREKREALGISLEEVSSRTHIKLEFLQVLEDETFHSLPDPVYLTGFLRRYARFLGLDADALVHEFRAQVSEAVIAKIEPLKRELPSAWEKWRRPSVLLFAIFLIPTVYFLSVSLISHRASKGNSAPPPAGSRSQLPTLGEGREQQKSSPEPSQSAPAPSKEKGHTLFISASEKTWLVIQADESLPREILLLEGQSLSLAARKRFLLTIGNAAGVQLVLDGERLPLAGSSGQVIRNLVLPPKKEG
jgi:cytoskeleton protein RodZ